MLKLARGSGSVNGDEPRKIRPLGNNELYQLARYSLDQYRGTSVLCRYRVPRGLTTKETVTDLKSIVNSAVAKVITQAPTLQAGILELRSKKPVWIHIGNLDLNEHVQWIFLDETADYEQAVQEVIQSQIDRKFFELAERPGWRLTIVKHATLPILDILFIWNHSHGDGMSGKIFHELLLEALKTVEPQESFKDLTNCKLDLPDSSRNFPPATEKLVELPVSASFVAKTLWSVYKPNTIFKNPTSATWAPMRSTPYKTKFWKIDIENGALSNILAACREHKTTLTALLHGLALVSLASHIEVTKATAFASSTAIDQRRFLPSNHDKVPWLEPRKTIANYVTIMDHEFDSTLVEQARQHTSAAGPKSDLSEDLRQIVWSTSTRVRQEIQHRLDSGLKNDMVGLMKFIPDWKAEFKYDMKRPRKLSWFITNLGVIDGTPTATEPDKVGQTWSIDRAQFTISTEIPVAALLITVMTAKNGALVIACTWQDTVVEDSLAQNFMADLQGWLNQIGTS